VPCFTLHIIFRQAQQSLIIQYAHQINAGQLPQIDSPFMKPEVWQNKVDCLFLDSDEATKEQLSFIYRVKRFFSDRTVAEKQTDEDLNPYWHGLSLHSVFHFTEPAFRPICGPTFPVPLACLCRGTASGAPTQGTPPIRSGSGLPMPKVKSTPINSS